jgi:p-aminobenzoyl-glutamate transporter AbgT
MEQIAQRSGGTAHTPSTLDALLQSVTQAASFQPQVVEESAETELWHAWMFLAVILLLLAAEWTLRKRYGLA